MIIQREILKKIKDEPLIFADILKRYNTGKLKLKPSTLERRLQRNSENVKTSSIIADYFREKGYTEEQIFENE